MMTEVHPKLVALVGGSGAGKSWLAERLLRVFGPVATQISLDDFYHDCSHLPPSRRAKINFDHPRAIDWPFVEVVLHDCRAGRLTHLPQYNFATHARLPRAKICLPAPLVLVDGLWLLWRARVRKLFDLRVFLECPKQLRLERRLARDISERERSADSVREQFWKTVAPMHDSYVAPQVRWADMALRQPSSEAEIRDLVRTLRALLPQSEAPPGEEVYATPLLASSRAAESVIGSTHLCPGGPTSDEPVRSIKMAAPPESVEWTGAASEMPSAPVVGQDGMKGVPVEGVPVAPLGLV